MSLVGRRIRKFNGDEAIVREVAFVTGEERWVALVRFDDGRLDSWDLYGCTEIEHKPAPYMRPPPTSMPGSGESG